MDQDIMGIEEVYQIGNWIFRKINTIMDNIVKYAKNDAPTILN